MRATDKRDVWIARCFPLTLTSRSETVASAMTGGSEMSVELFDEGEVWADEEDLLGSEEDLGVEVLSPEEAVSYIQHADSSPLYEHYRVIADKGQALLRVDKFLASRMTGS